MPPELLYQRDEYVIVALLFGLLMLAAEAGYRGGRRIAARLAAGSKPGNLGTLQGAMIGLLALLLAFTIQMAVSRFEARKLLVVKEANAIGTAVLRSRLLPDPARQQAADLFRRYLGRRLEIFDTVALSAIAKAARDDATRLQNELWELAVRAAKQNPNVVPSGLFITALNDLIDVAGERDAAQTNHVPESVLGLLFLVATLTMGLVGYGYGFTGRRDPRAVLITVTVITLVILAILDLDRPVRGIIAVGQRSMIELRDNPVWLEPSVENPADLPSKAPAMR